jgi:hypothetical protein
MTLYDVKQRILDHNGPVLYHGTSGKRAASILEHGLDPSKTGFCSTAVWVATREIAGRYAFERGNRRDGHAVFSVDLRQIPAAQLHADEQIAFEIHGPVAEQRIRADLAAYGINADGLTVEEIDDEVADRMIDLTWQMIEDEGFDFSDPEMVWRSYAETGCLMITGTVLAHAVAVAEHMQAVAA